MNPSTITQPLPYVREPGQRVGPYELLRLLGTGPAAQDWLARRADGAFERTLLLRVPAFAPPLTPEVAQAFDRDRDVLSALEHPNIARLYDAGVSAGGLPYLALEHFEGDRLIDWCDSRRLDLRARLRLFIQAVDAVSYALARGVLHLDLGPDSIVVSTLGQVRVVGFGVLHRIGGQAEPAPSRESGVLQATMAVASGEEPVAAQEAPENVRALGAILHELVGGQMPGAGACPEPPPSRHLARDAAILRSTTTGGLLRELRGDLDAIVAMALAGDERARYRDPRAFAEDLNHFLRGAPVRARPDTAWSRACRWGDRNRQTVLLALLGFSIALPGFAWLSFADLVRERHGARPPAASDAVKSIAVLPFTDLAGERDQRFLAEGLSEELIARLSRASGLRVIARNSAFQFRGSNVDVREIASRLGVTHVLEGSMRRSGSRLRIMAELVRATDGTRLWSETYDRSMGDIVRLQDEIAGTVAEELAVALQAPDRRAGPVATPEAYDRLLRGNYHFARVTRGDTEEALGLYEEATRLDPMFARAWAQLARTLVRQAGYGWISPGAVASTSRAAARKAVEIDPGMAEAHLALAEVLRDFDWDWEGSLAEFARAQDIDPENQVARYRLADLKVLLGRGDFNEEIRALKEAIARDPLDGNSINYLGDVLREAGRFEESSQTFERLVHMDQRFAAVQGNFALTLLEMGRPAEALRAADSEIDEVWRGTVRACVLWAQGGHAESQAELDRLSTREPSLVAYNLAQAHACRGERDQAFAWLDRAFTYRISDLREIRYERLLIPLREDPRFDRLLQRMKLPPIRD